MHETHLGLRSGSALAGLGLALQNSTELYWISRPIRSHSQQLKLRLRAEAADLVTRWSELHASPCGGRLVDVV